MAFLTGFAQLATERSGFIIQTAIAFRHHCLGTMGVTHVSHHHAFHRAGWLDLHNQSYSLHGNSHQKAKNNQELAPTHVLSTIHEEWVQR
jgi:hypothetical protein